MKQAPMKQTPIKHGQIMGGTVTTPDLAAALGDYRDTLGLRLVEQGALPADLAASWGCPASAGAAFALLQPQSGAPCHIRLVEQPAPEGFRPTTSFGWAAYEITVQDVEGWPRRLEGSGFAIAGAPKAIAGMPEFVPMQVIGRGHEMLYLNQVFADMAGTDLPKAQSPVDHIFILILATPDRAASIAFYRQALGLEATATFTIRYSMINKAFGFDEAHLTDLSMVQNGRLPVLEIDQYPPEAGPRPGDPQRLPAGNAMVTLACQSLDAVNAPFLAPPAVREGPFYAGRRAATLRATPGSELVELIEIG